MTSHKAGDYKIVLKRRLVAEITYLGASERQETKVHKTWSLCQPQIALWQPQELQTATFQAQKHTPPVHKSCGIPSSVVLWFYSLLHSASTVLNLIAVVTSFAWSNLIGAPRTWRLEQKLNRLTIFPLRMRKVVRAWDYYWPAIYRPSDWLHGAGQAHS